MKCRCAAVDGEDEDETLNRCMSGGVERFAKQFPV